MKKIVEKIKLYWLATKIISWTAFTLYDHRWNKIVETAIENKTIKISEKENAPIATKIIGV